MYKIGIKKQTNNFFEEIEFYDFTALRCPLVQSQKLSLEKLFSIVVHSTSVRQLQLLLGDMFSLLRIRMEIWSLSSFTICPCNVNKIMSYGLLCKTKQTNSK